MRKIRIFKKKTPFTTHEIAYNSVYRTFKKWAFVFLFYVNYIDIEYKEKWYNI